MSSNPRDHRYLIQNLQLKLRGIAQKRTKDWWEKYLRYSIEFRGVNIVAIKEALNQWFADEGIEAMSTRSQLELALSFFAEKYAEDKLAGILFLQEYIIPRNEIGWIILVSKIDRIFNAGYIHDWNVCDWLCVRVLGPLIESNKRPCAEAIAGWRSSENLWQARASVVSFVNIAKSGDQVVDGLSRIILPSCAELIKRSERFAKTGAGWVLRELSQSDEKAVTKFIELNKEYFSKESFENAVKRLKPSEQERLRSL